MRSFIPLRHLLAVTHGSVFLFTALFIGFSTYFITKDAYEHKNSAAGIPQISEKVSADENKEDYLVYERREVMSFRPNNLNREQVTGYVRELSTGEENIAYSFIDDPL